MQHSSTLDDRLLALDVETALKALGIVAGENDARDGDLRLAVEDLRRAALPVKRMMGESRLFTPPMVADDDEILTLR